jgi:hypothetical protein
MTAVLPETDTAARLAALEDRLALVDLLSAYARGIDTEDFPLLERVVTPDVRAEHGVVTPPLEGRDAWFGVLRYFSPRFRHVRHHVTNVEVALDGDRAHVRALLVAVHDTAADSSLVPAGADYAFGAVRTPDGWCFDRVVVEETWADPRVPALYAPGDPA